MMKDLSKQEPTVIEEKEPNADIDAAIKGDATAFGRLFDMYVDRIYRHIYYRVGNVQDAEDMTQQTFTNAFQSIGRFRRSGTPFIGWLMRISHNLIVDLYRSKKPNSDIDKALDLQDSNQDPPSTAEGHMLQSTLRRHILKLPEDQQKVILMHFIDGMKYEEIARVTGKSEGAIRVLQHRGLKALRTAVDSKEILAWQT